MSKPTLLKVSPGFARLLATENIGVRVDPAASTALFDTKHRILTMPNWNASDRLRDMLIAHECAHAIFTDASDLVTIVTDRVGPNFPIAKDYLNVCEDARIDRLIQRRYPGLRRDYAAGYREMVDKDFFGVAGRDCNALPLIDRINLHFKGRRGEITFTAEEQVFVDRLEIADTFDEICEIARDLYNYAGTKNESMSPQTSVSMSSPDNGEDAGDEQDGQQDGQQDGEGEESSAAAGEGDTEGEDGSSSVASAGGEEEGDANETETSASYGPGYTKSSDPASCQTLREFEKNQQNLAESNNSVTPVTLEMPRERDIDLDRIIYSSSKILRDAEDLGITAPSMEWSEFLTAIKPTVTNLVALFERKKAAAIATRSQVAKTGRLDMTMLHKYRMTEDIFLRTRIEAKGKNHGLVAYVDWSGSMSDCMKETVAQATLLALFCKKVGIPFRIYGFTTWLEQDNLDAYYSGSDTRFYPALPADAGWDSHERMSRLYLSNFTLLEIFSSEMDKVSFDRMGSLLLNVGAYHGSYVNRQRLPRCLDLSGTPLNESIIAAMKIGNAFKRQYNIDVLNSIWITDGGDGNPFRGTIGTVQNRDTGMVWTLNHQDSCRGTDVLFRMYKHSVGGNLIGIYLSGTKAIRSTIYYGSEPNAEKKIEKFNRDRFVEMKHDGYDTYFLMDKSVAVYTGNDAMETLPTDASNTRIVNAFRKDLCKRAISRPLLNTFTDRIAREIA